MRKIFLCCSLFILLVIAVFINYTQSVGGETKKGGRFDKLTSSSSGLSKTTVVNRPFWAPNRAGMYITNDGQLVSPIPTGSAGMQWPVGSNNTINFASGIWIGGVKRGQIVVASGEFVVEFQPGPIVGSSPGVAGTATNPNDPKYKVYIINDTDVENPSGNPDYVNWPYSDGAPFVLNPDGTKRPGLIGNSTTWSVFNDLNQVLHDRRLASPVMGVEVQQTTWAFNRIDAFGDMIFFKFKVINKAGANIDSCFISLWADVDVGDSQDLVGCDTTLSLGYVYKTQADGLYGAVAPAIGYDFFQGPIVPSPGDTALVSGRRMPGFRNLPMSSYAKYINAGPPQYSDPGTAQEAYSFMNGFDRVGNPIIDATTNRVTKFWHSGDPAAGTGWLDTQHGDKRFLMNCGPFKLADGDTQEVVAGMVIAQGSDAASTIRLLRQADQSAQTAYDNDFVLPGLPLAPITNVVADSGSLLIQWNDRSESYNELDKLHVDLNGGQTFYTFQGYNIYQVDELNPSKQSTIKKVATFDIIDGVNEIRDNVIDEATGGVANRIVQKSDDAGISRYIRLTSDEIRGKVPLVSNRRYYYAVTAYGYNPFGSPKILESPIKPFLAIPVGQPLGSRLNTPSGQMFNVAHANPGPVKSDGSVSPIVIDPAALTDHNYSVVFRATHDENGGPPFVWDVVDDTDNHKVKVSGWVNQGTSGAGDYPMVDGMLMRVVGPPLVINRAEYSSPDNSPRWFNGNNWGGDVIGGGLGLGVNFFGSNVTPDQYVTVELRFRTNADGQRAYTYLRGGTPNYRYTGYELQHFTAWEVTPGQPERQLNVAFVEQNGQQNGLWDPSNAAARNYLFILRSTYSGDTPDPYYTSRIPNSQAGEFDTLYSLWPVLAADVTAPAWADGQVLKITPNFVNTDKDIFSFKSTAPVKNDMTLAKKQLNLVNVFPNPYTINFEQRDNINRFVTFTHLAETARIRIYSLTGELVRVIEHTDGTQLERWDLRNSSQVPVASGIYIAHISLPSIGERVLKLAVFQPEERLDVF